MELPLSFFRENPNKISFVEFSEFLWLVEEAVTLQTTSCSAFSPAFQHCVAGWLRRRRLELRFWEHYEPPSEVRRTIFEILKHFFWQMIPHFTTFPTKIVSEFAMWSEFLFSETKYSWQTTDPTNNCWVIH